MASVRARRHAAATLAVVVVATLAASPAAAWTVAQSDHITKTMSWDVECDKSSYVPFVEGCHTSQCGRYVVDDFVSEDDLATLRGIVEKGMASQPATGGPTILDINSGFIKGPAGLAIIYPEVEFSQEEYDTYAAVFTKIRATIMGAFGSEVEQLWFTAPTFITREIGEEGWEPAEIHDEYWHEHVDKDNTEHYGKLWTRVVHGVCWLCALASTVQDLTRRARDATHTTRFRLLWPAVPD